MSFADRIWDDEGFTAGPQSSMPTVQTQLYALGLYRASRDEQVAGMREWLRDHTPKKSLRADIAREMPELVSASQAAV